jgi:hypothetical protein
VPALQQLRTFSAGARSPVIERGMRSIDGLLSIGRTAIRNAGEDGPARRIAYVVPAPPAWITPFAGNEIAGAHGI